MPQEIIMEKSNQATELYNKLNDVADTMFKPILERQDEGMILKNDSSRNSFMRKMSSILDSQIEGNQKLVERGGDIAQDALNQQSTGIFEVFKDVIIMIDTEYPEKKRMTRSEQRLQKYRA